MLLHLDSPVARCGTEFVAVAGEAATELHVEIIVALDPRSRDRLYGELLDGTSQVLRTTFVLATTVRNLVLGSAACTAGPDVGFGGRPRAPRCVLQKRRFITRNKVARRRGSFPSSFGIDSRPFYEGTGRNGEAALVNSTADS